MTGPALELLGVYKRFGAVEALRGASLSVAPGAIHALLGENGAGKSTLMHVAGGLVRPDAGVVRVGPGAATPRSPHDARRLGVGMVHQHPSSVPSLRVFENVALSAGWRVRPAELRRRVAQLGERLGLPLDPDAFAGRLPIALKQRLELVKALASDARLLLLDEPTAVLAPAEAEELLRVVRQYVRAGNAAVLITHKLTEALAVSDHVTVLRRGTVTLVGATSQQSVATLADAMLGSAAAPAPRASPEPNRDAAQVVEAHALDIARDGRYGIAVRAAALAVRSGEIVGVAAVEGNGQRELLRAVAGRILPLRGTLRVQHPVAFIPEDRTTEGLIPAMSLAENYVLGLGSSATGVRDGRINWGEVREGARDLLSESDVRASGPDAEAGTLSGGNQQKFVVARALAAKPRVIVAENPTRGLDLAASAAVHRRLREAADGGAGILLYSSDLDEVLEYTDRVVVLARGVLLETPAGANRELIGRLMVGAA